jgi:16S rRNA processing protein RimM
MNDYIPIGVIVNTHGLKGNLKVKTESDFKEERYRTGQILYIKYKGDLKAVTVQSYQTVKNLDHVKFAEFNHINDCEKYKGCELFVHKDALSDLDENEFYYEELMGMSVRGDSFEGTVENVREMPKGALLSVMIPGRKKPVLIPFNKEFIESVDKEKNEITIYEWEGLL